jgi:hypothetical protein
MLRLPSVFPSLVCLALCAGLIGCKTGFNRPFVAETSTASIPCNPTAVDSNASSEALALLKIVATFSCEKDTESTKRVLSGQVLGTVSEAQNIDRYNELFANFQNNDGSYNTPAVLGMDYALNSRHDTAELTNANDVLEPHADLGGLIVVSWTPSNPWESGFNTGYTSQVDLPALLQSFSSDAKSRWQDDVKQLANTLLNLQHRRVAVILRPLPLMNSDRYWWGINATGANKENDFKELWSDLFKQLNDAGVENVIWAYSPLDTAEPNTKAFNWGFNKEFVDLVTPVVRNDNLDIRDYDAYKTLGKPMGLAEYSPATGSGNFDTLKYETRLITNYPAMAFWMSGVNDGNVKRTLVDNKNAYELLVKSTVINAENVDSQNLTTTN